MINNGDVLERIEDALSVWVSERQKGPGTTPKTGSDGLGNEDTNYRRRVGHWGNHPECVDHPEDGQERS